MVYLDLNKPWSCGKKKWTGMTYLCTIIALRNQTVACDFFLSSDSPNGCRCQERLLSSRNFATMVTCSGRSRPSDKGGGQSSRPWDKVGARLKKNFCQSFEPQFGLRIRGGGQPGPSPGSTTDLMSHFSSLWSLDSRGIKLKAPQAMLIKLAMTKMSASLIYLCTYRL